MQAIKCEPLQQNLKTSKTCALERFEVQEALPVLKIVIATTKSHGNSITDKQVTLHFLGDRLRLP